MPLCPWPLGTHLGRDREGRWKGKGGMKRDWKFQGGSGIGKGKGKGTGRERDCKGVGNGRELLGTGSGRDR